MIRTVSNYRRLDLTGKKHQTLSNDDLASLCLSYQNGCQKSLDKLVNANMKFVVKIANKYQGQGVPVEDLINEGALGLIPAAKKFDPAKKFFFITYAVWWVRQSILTAIREQNDGIRAPTQSQIKSCLKLAKKLKHKQRIESAERRMIEFKLIRNPKSLEAMAEKGFNPEGNFDLPDSNILKMDQNYEIEKLLSPLKEDDRILIKRHFGLINDLPVTLKDIAIEKGLSRQRIEAIKSACIKKIKRLNLQPI